MIKDGKKVQAAAQDAELPLQVYCICRSSDEHNMIMCDCCEEWYHYKCINLTPVSMLTTLEILLDIFVLISPFEHLPILLSASFQLVILI